MSSKIKMNWVNRYLWDPLAAISKSDLTAKKRQSCKDLGEEHSYHVDKYPDTGDYCGICRDQKKRERKFDVGDILKAGWWSETESERGVWRRSDRGLLAMVGVRTSLW